MVMAVQSVKVPGQSWRTWFPLTIEISARQPSIARHRRAVYVIYRPNRGEPEAGSQRIDSC
jgi:hypothetical protein